MIQQFLHTVALFRELSDEELTQVLMVGLVKRYAQGTVILAEGAAGGQLQIIHSGKVRVSKLVPGVGEEALTILGKGDFFGEVEFFDGFPASAHVIAHTDCVLLAIPHDEIRNLMASRPDVSSRFLWAFAQTLASRLRDSNQRLGSLLAISR